MSSRLKCFSDLGGTFVPLQLQCSQRQIEAERAMFAEGIAMISHCANPDCKLPFHYWRGGRLYRFDIRNPSAPCNDVPNGICSQKPSQATVFFWLCEQCSLKYSLRFNIRDGLALASLTNPVRKGSTAPVIAVPDSAADREDDEDAGELR